MKVADTGGDGQSQAGSSISAIVAGAPETIKHFGLLIGVEPHTAVEDGDAGHAATLLTADAYGAARFGVTARMVQQVAQQVMQQGAVAAELNPWNDFGDELDLFLGKKILLQV